MGKELRILTCQPNDRYFCWQLRVQLNNLRKYGLSDKYTALIWHHNDRAGKEVFFDDWNQLMIDYPEAEFITYQDETGELQRLIKVMNYIPLLRPWLLSKYFKEKPELKDKAILYMDSDVVFTKKPNFENLIHDDVHYLSDTRSYIAASYFDSKIKDVLPERLEEYKQIDVLDDLMKEFGLTRLTAESREEGSGGAQYLLKNIDANFWQNVFTGCLKILMNLRSVNRRFFENENKGFQSWCADMWSILFNLWAREGYNQTNCPWEMDFCWATDPIGKWDQVQIYHDAGATSRNHSGAILFHKREAKYINNLGTPFEDDFSDVSKDYCSSNYVKEIEEASNIKKKFTDTLKQFTPYIPSIPIEDLKKV